eukprot:Phypoly_transcript_02495.p1 GENE.Phypoly_transcript_02495~~Phypoly_transcript_02495.p1  ORF type:complete len:752 (+),score=113.21 Phypoly_transcript_02495:98-2353(+)
MVDDNVDLLRHPRPATLPPCASPFYFGPNHPLVSFLDTCDDVISIYDTDYNFIYGNRAWERFFEKLRKDTYGYTLFTMWTDGRFTLENPLAKMYQKAVEEQAVQHKTVFHPRMHKWTVVSVYPNVEGFLVHLKDITEHKKEEENTHKMVLSNKELTETIEESTRALNKEREVTSWAISKSPDAVMALDKDFIFFEFNPVMERVTGISKSEVLGKHYLEVFPGLQNPSFERLLHELLVQGTTLTDVLVEISDQPPALQPLFTEYYEKNCVPIIPKGESSPVGAVFFFHDMTPHKKAQEALEHREAETARARDEALQLAKAKSDFLANMSHEIRTPLNAVIGIGELLCSGSMNKRQIDESYSILSSNANNLLGIVNQVLDFSKAEAGKLVLENYPFEIDKVFEEISQTFQMQAASKKPTALGFQFHVSDHAILSKTVMGDRSRLQGVLNNLLGNSIKFTHSGSVTLEVHVESETDDVISILAQVRDTGIGMDQAALAKLFSPFSQADASTTRNYGGTGLGLSITKMIVECMKGTIKVESTKGVGTTFSVRVTFEKYKEIKSGSLSVEVGENGCMPSILSPTRLISPRNDLAKIQNPQVVFTNGMGVSSDTLHHHLKSCPMCPHLNVLVAEDNPVNRHIVSLQLSKLGVKSKIVENGLEALQALAADFERKFNLVLMDIQMPVLDGYGAVRAIREKSIYDELPVVAMTADALPEDRMRSTQVGMDDYISKPLTIGSLAGLFHKWANVPAPILSS